MSVRRQFILAFIVFAVVLSGTIGVVGFRVSSEALEERLDNTLTQVASTAASLALRADVIGLIRRGNEQRQEFRPYYIRLTDLRDANSALEAVIFDRDGRLLMTSEFQPGVDSLLVGSPLSWVEMHREAIDEAWETGRATTPLFTLSDGRQGKYGFAVLRDGEGEYGDAMLALLVPANFFEPLSAFRRTVILLSTAAALLGAVLAAFLATGISRPVDRLSRVALRIQRGRLDEPVSLEPGVELGRLSRAMERMRVGVHERDERLRLMLAQVAHEIRNPLGGLELFASALSEETEPSERERLLNRIRSEIRALDTIIKDFLTFARPPDPGVEFQDLRVPLTEAAELVEAEIGHDEKALTVSLSEEPLLARADPGQVKRVVLNLLRNAAQAGREVELGAQVRNGEIEIRVRDDGPGVPEEMQDRIFDPFVTDKEQGAGLGLAIVRQLTESNHGRIELTSPADEAVGTGAEFRVYFVGAEEFSDEGTSRYL